MDMNMSLDMYTAFREGGLDEPHAKAVVSAITKVIDSRYEHHADHLATKGDLAELKADLRTEMANMKVDIVRWNVVTMFGAVGMIAAVMKFLH